MGTSQLGIAINLDSSGVTCHANQNGDDVSEFGISFIVPGKPNRWQRAGRNGKRTFTPATMAQSELDISHAAAAAMRHAKLPLFDCALSLSFMAAFPIPKIWMGAKRIEALRGNLMQLDRPDIDNILKLIDALNGVVWTDDARVVHLGDCVKCFSTNPRLEMRIEPFTGNMSGWFNTAEYMLDT